MNSPVTPHVPNERTEANMNNPNSDAAPENHIHDESMVSRALENITAELQETKELLRESKVEVTKKTSALLNIMEYNDDDEWTDTSSDPESEELEEIFVHSRNPRKTTTESSDTDSELDVTEYDKSQSLDSDVEIISVATPNNNSQVMKKPEDNPNTYGEPLPPVADLSDLVIEDNEDFLHIGNVHSIVDTVVTISSNPDTPAYDLETVLYIEKGSTKIPLGEIFDVIGPVSSPFYCVRLESNSDMKEKGIESEVTKVFSIPRSPRTRYIFVKQLMEAKYTDATGEDDVEVTEDTSDEEYNKEPPREQPAPNRRRKRAAHQLPTGNRVDRNGRGQFSHGCSSSSPSPSVSGCSMRPPIPNYDNQLRMHRSLPAFGVSFNGYLRPPGFENHSGMRGPPPPPPFWNDGPVRPWNDFGEHHRPPVPYRFRGGMNGPRFSRGSMGPPHMGRPYMGPRYS